MRRWRGDRGRDLNWWKMRQKEMDLQGREQRRCDAGEGGVWMVNAEEKLMCWKMTTLVKQGGCIIIPGKEMNNEDFKDAVCFITKGKS